ncbi:acyltransferase domain-containing protein [Buchnera aphidicola]|uniref:acyltransferase domain-containing protein n=1 Tax=Buchnera aphidicola TaxID=9 RepID=UPI00346480B0
MIFPGQGLQKPCHLINLNQYNHIIKNTFYEASEYLKNNMWNMIKNKNNVNKKHHQYIQSITFISSVALYRFWIKISGIKPIIASGHSLGEYSALVCSNAIKFSDAIKLVHKRELMMNKQSLKNKLQMNMIVGLEKKKILNICKKYSKNKIVNIAAINTNKQIVISGHKKSVENTIIACKKMGAKYTIKLPISIAAHCSIMKKIRRNLSKKLKKINIKNTQYPIISSTSTTQYKSKHTIRKSLIEQLFKPVQWEKTMKFIISKSDIILEVGTNDFLTRTYKKKNNKKFISINSIKNINYILQLLNNHYD